MAEASLKRDLETAGANLKKEAESTANRVGGEFQRGRAPGGHRVLGQDRAGVGRGC